MTASPVSPVMPVRVIPRAVFFRVMLAPATGPPLGSVTVALTAASCWANTWSAKKRSKNVQRLKAQLSLGLFTIPPDDDEFGRSLAPCISKVNIVYSSSGLVTLGLLSFCFPLLEEFERSEVAQRLMRTHAVVGLLPLP